MHCLEKVANLLWQWHWFNNKCSELICLFYSNIDTKVSLALLPVSLQACKLCVTS
jgi:hypothetical protein